MPIDVKELRIGNYIQHLKPIQIIGIKSRKILVGSFMSTSPDRYHQQPISVEDWVDAVMCNPIELTPDILVKMGFKEVHQFTPGVGGFKTYHLGHLTLLPNDTPNYDTEIGGYTTGFYRHPIKYVHHLQNLHYFLSGEELNYIP